MKDKLAVLILAAGLGTRMKSNLVKVLHPLMGRPMLWHVLETARALNPERIVTVVGHQAEQVRAQVGAPDISFAFQERQLGTGDAVNAARGELADFDGDILILSGDVPLLSAGLLTRFLADYRASGAAASVLTTELAEPGTYGRIIRGSLGFIARIVEARDAQDHELRIEEINSGIYAVSSSLLFELVQGLDTNNDQHEFYLTDIVGLANQRGRQVSAFVTEDSLAVLGVNNRAELARAAQALRMRINQAWLTAGVGMISPEQTYIETSVELARDVTLWPGVHLLGATRVGEGALIEPGCFILDSVIGKGARVRAGTRLESITVEENAEV